MFDFFLFCGYSPNMPSRGYKKPDPKAVVLRFRVTEEEAEALKEASSRATKRGFSDWVRTVTLEEAERLGVALPKESG